MTNVGHLSSLSSSPLTRSSKEKNKKQHRVQRVIVDRGFLWSFLVQIIINGSDDGNSAKFLSFENGKQIIDDDTVERSETARLRNRPQAVVV